MDCISKLLWVYFAIDLFITKVRNYKYESCKYLFSLHLFLFKVPPLFVTEFLHRVMDTFEDYFNECTESAIKENYVIVYEVSE